MKSASDTVIQIIHEAGWSYPVSVRRIENHRPMTNIAIDESGNSMMLSELLNRAEINKFRSPDHVEEVLTELCLVESQHRRVGLLGKLKQSFFADE